MTMFQGMTDRTAIQRLGSLAILMAVLGLGLSGCEKKADSTTTPAATDADHDGDGHDHDEDGHDHSAHHLGTHGGHMVTLEPGDIEAEWVILDEGKELQVFVLKAAEQVKTMAMHVQVGDDQLDPYELKAAEQLGAGAWQLSDPALFNHVKMTADHDAGVKVEIVAETDAEPAKATITHHQH